ncbi:glutamine synthetase inactivating factor IF7 [Nostoc sp. 'Lobaria pulmonaria (5183) cyanobiont']|nr:glutamine synthetase inactivating factor IF7 [Nostoc sp. 'Lobaria pulmonaria (5183) cyanobiont']
MLQKYCYISLVRKEKLYIHEIERTMIMSIADKSRALMVREHQQVKNRQQSILMRAAQELGLPEEASHYWNPIQGKVDANTRMIYGPSHASMS